MSCKECYIKWTMCECELNRQIEETRKEERERAQKIIEECPEDNRCKSHDSDCFSCEVIEWKQEALKKLNIDS